MFRPIAVRALRALCVATALTGLATGSASAAIGPTISNAYFSAHATSACGSSPNAALHVTSKRDNLDVTVSAAGIYNANGALINSTGMQGLGSPYYETYLYAGATLHLNWTHNRPGHNTVKFYVRTQSTVVVAVPVAC
jgi:hypothetical protein